jgi:thymidylate synthase (FAD)
MATEYPTVELVEQTPNAVHLCAWAARICTGLADEPHDREDDVRLMKRIIASGHESVLEHAVFTFRLRGVSRCLTHQLVRHRLASYEEVSQRYVDVWDGFHYIVPGTIAKDDFLLSVYKEQMTNCQQAYRNLLESGVPEEDARYVLPGSWGTDIVVTMNARELRHFFALRCCNRAQWEIRAVADRMLELVRQTEAAPLFEEAGPGCVRGQCPEGKRTCGHPREMKA